MEYVLIMTDVFSKFTQAVPTRDQHASMVAQVVVTEWFYKFGVPSQLHSDQGRSFESCLIQQLCGQYGVTHKRLQQIVWTAERITDTTLPTLQELYLSSE